MCGIAGLYHPAGIDPLRVRPMVDSLRHRGPDAGASFYWGPNQAGATHLGMGTRRLAIVDPTGGAQPILDKSGRFALCFNGEIYNHARLHQELVESGVELRTRSDGEVLIELIARDGLERALQRLTGMFAFALFDRRTERIQLVRDRVGVKPLYYALLSGNGIAFASEPRALLQLAEVDRREDRIGLQSLLCFEYIPAPRTAWLGIQKLEAGSLLECGEDGRYRSRTWWRPPPLHDGHEGDAGRWARSLRGCLDIAVQRRLEADVPVGVLLSGGLDSSGVCAIAAQLSPNPVHTFSVRVEADGFDEAPWARQVAASVGTIHREIPFQAGDFLELFAEIAQHTDEPLADSSLPATWLLMRHVQASGFRCVLSGDGADEVFGGYPTVQAHRLARVAGWARGPLQATLARIPPNYSGVTWDFKARRFAEGLGQAWHQRHQVWMGAWEAETIGADPNIWAPVIRAAQWAEGSEPASRPMALDQQLYLAEGVLTKVDRTSMAHGIKVRSPFLDHSIWELAAQIGLDHKVRGNVGKWILRQTLSEILPPGVLKRNKQGFGTPVGPWLRGPAASLLNNLVEATEDLIPAPILQATLNAHRSGQADHRRRLWSAIVLASWRNGSWHR